MEWGRLPEAGMVAGATLFAVGALFHVLAPAFAPHLAAEYRNDALFRPWTGWTRLYMLAHPWLYGLMVAALFLGVRALAGAEHFGGPRDGLLFGVTLFAAGSLPVYALNFASFRCPPV